MPYVNPIIGYWTDHGYTLCVPCANITDYAVVAGWDPIDSGNGAAIGCVCDACGADVGVLYDPTNRVHVNDRMTASDRSNDPATFP
jgi:hypothetical protein